MCVHSAVPKQQHVVCPQLYSSSPPTSHDHLLPSDLLAHSTHSAPAAYSLMNLENMTSSELSAGGHFVLLRKGCRLSEGTNNIYTLLFLLNWLKVV